MKNQRRLISSMGVLLLGACAFALVVRVAAERTMPVPAVPQSPASGFPLRFEPVPQGERIAIAADALGGRIALEGATLGLSSPGGAGGWTLAFANAAPAATAEALAPAAGPTRLLVEGQAALRPSAMPASRSLEARAVYPGIDLAVDGATDRVDLQLAFAADADPGVVSFRIDGATARLEGDGTVRWTTEAGDFVLLPPSAWRDSDGDRHALGASFDMAADGTIAVRIDGADGGAPSGARLTVWASRLGAAGASTSNGWRVALDADGAAYVTGAVAARSGAPGDGGDILVPKLDRAGRDFEWVSYVGTDRTDAPAAIAVDAAGRIAVAGESGGDA